MRTPRARLRRGGFSVLELSVALAVGGVVLLGARAMFLGLERASADVRSLAVATDRDANGERLLRSLVRQIESSGDGAAFGGDTVTTRFKSWCSVADGWKERCTVTLRAERRNGESIIAIVTSVGDTIGIQRRSARASFRYIGAVARGGTWFEQWGAGLSVPAAVAIAFDGDTVILRTGPLH